MIFFTNNVYKIGRGHVRHFGACRILFGVLYFTFKSFQIQQGVSGTKQKGFDVMIMVAIVVSLALDLYWVLQERWSGEMVWMTEMRAVDGNDQIPFLQ